MMPRLRLVLALVALLASGCIAARPAATGHSALTLRDEIGHDETLAELAARAPLTVLVFFDADCPVLKAHDRRIRDMVNKYGARGVSFLAIVSEHDADMVHAREAVAQRSLHLTVLEDRAAALADSLGVEFASHSFVLDRTGAVLYSGAVDSDRTHMTSEAEHWLENAIDAALHERPIDKPETEPLGCPLRKH